MQHLKIIKLNYIILTLSILGVLKVKGQDTLILKNLKNISCVSIDAKGNKYISDDLLTLYKYGPDNKLITNVNNKSYGNITSIDCSNPFEIYVFYKDQNILVFFDNMLNIRGEVRLNDFQMNNVACVSRSYDNHIWLIDMSENKLLKISKSGERLDESNDLNSITAKPINPYKVWELNGQVHVADSTIGVFTFDIYTTLDKTYYTQSFSSITSSTEGLYYNQKGTVVKYNKLLRTPINTNTYIPSEARLAIDNDNLYYYYDNEIISLKHP